MEEEYKGEEKGRRRNRTGKSRVEKANGEIRDRKRRKRRERGEEREAVKRGKGENY